MFRAVCESRYLRVYYVYSQYLMCAAEDTKSTSRLTVNSFIEKMKFLLIGILYVLKKPGFTHCSDLETDLKEK